MSDRISHLRPTWVLMLALLLSGCARMVWEKPGANEGEFEATKGHCIGQAYAQLPPALATTTVGSGYITPSYTSCSGGPYVASCTTTGGQYVPPSVVQYDANASARVSVFKGCMYANGWYLVRKKN